jgi:signal transduction histidine kinase
MKRSLRFKASARLQSILSRELVADSNVALLEFVKNGYDAAANKVVVQFELGDHPRESAIWIADNGDGMDLPAFERDWMRPGYSKKATYDPPPGKRVPVGEKGLGRLAAGRLGGTLDVFTRPTARVNWLHAHFRWSDFDDMNRDLDEVKIAIDDEHEPAVTAATTGTVICISDLHLNWNARVPGRKVPGRSDTRLGRLRQDLEVLLLPLTVTDDDFEITLEHNSSLSEDKPGRVEPPVLEALDYAFEFSFKEVRKKWETTYTVRRSDTIAYETGAPALTRGRVPLPALPLDADPAVVGAFDGSFLYATPRSAARLKEMRAPLGVRIYRDGVRVDPYGEESDDWLGARARKASRQGYAAIQPNALYGAVQISKAENRSLVAMANREGLVENESFDAFVAICRSLFAEFEKIVYDEYVEPKWRTLPEKRQAAAESQQAFAFMLARTAVHAVRQPVSGAGAELSRLQHVVESADLATNVKKELKELHDRTLAHLIRIEDIVARMLDVFDFEPEPTDLDLAALAASVVATISASAESHGVDLTVRPGSAHPIVSVSQDLITHALTELIENAIHAERAAVGGSVEVVVEEVDGEAILTVVDDGDGVPDEIRKHLFTRAQSTRGHIGFGLVLARQMLRLMRGDVRLVSTGADGTAFRIVLPIPHSDGGGTTGNTAGRGR